MRIHPFCSLLLVFVFFASNVKANEFNEFDYYNDGIDHYASSDDNYDNDIDNTSSEFQSADADMDEYPVYASSKKYSQNKSKKSYGGYASRLPARSPSPGEKVILINPNRHVWGAYSANGNLVKAGIATAGAKWCRDIGRPCKTKAGTFLINSLGSSDCKSRKYPVGRGGAPMPYCMFFNGGQGLHGSYELAEANLSHGCVRISVSNAEWLRYYFARVGTKVIVRPY